MSLKSLLAPHVSQFLTSPERLARRRARTEQKRHKRGEPHRLHYFHDARDPYSHLMVQLLPRLSAGYEVEIECHLVSAPPDWAAPDRERLDTYARKDAERLAGKIGLTFQDPGHQPPDKQLLTAEHEFAGLIQSGTFTSEAARISQILWQDGEFVPATAGSGSELKSAGDKLRQKLGHYLGGTIHYGGEWYWGPDRLQHLEQRLTELGARKADAASGWLYAQPACPVSGAETRLPAPDLHFYMSFRSPYTYIAAARVKALADAYGAGLKLRFVLPMVMRGLPVPAAKRRYILQDATREARRVDVPFGRINDPLGKPVERGYALLPWAVEAGKGVDYSLSFMRGVWSEGIDAGSDKGLRLIVERAGLDWGQARQLIGNDDWRPEAEANRQEMMELGLWGVPSFRVGNTATWGQDRLWVVEEALQNGVGCS